MYSAIPAAAAAATESPNYCFLPGTGPKGDGAARTDMMALVVGFTIFSFHSNGVLFLQWSSCLPGGSQVPPQQQPEKQTVEVDRVASSSSSSPVYNPARILEINTARHCEHTCRLMVVVDVCALTKRSSRRQTRTPPCSVCHWMRMSTRSGYSTKENGDKDMFK